MGAGGGHAHGIHKIIGAFFGDGKREVWVFVNHCNGIAGIVRGKRSLATFHLIENFVHHIGLYNTFLLFQLFCRFLNFFGRRGVQAHTQLFKSNGKGITAVVEHQHISFVLLIPQRRPAVNGALHHGFVIYNTHNTPGVRYGVFIIGVIVQPLVLVADHCNIRDITKIQLGKHALF
ncbi:hypothetical protein SDC9_171822 [bioreactor metagenome]|uniref:Uncharacterized protein n=1 Tax=bioreactor metagenome TaxID=1076179 RepID=A0A645GL24_9ZZZZ